MMPYKDKAKAKACQKAWADKQGKEYWKQRYQDYKEQYQEKGQTYRLQVLIHNSKTDDDAGIGTSLSNIPFCACCGEKTLEFLSLDHIKGGGTKHREQVGRGQRLYQWLIKNDFPEGYRVLCYNCNCSLGHYGYCPHSHQQQNSTVGELTA